MAFILIGDDVTLSASGTGTIRLRTPTSGKITKFLVNSTGRAKITNIEISGVKDFFNGELEIEQLKEYGNTYHLPEPLDFPSGSDLIVNLTDLSGASNTVFFAVEVKTE